MYRLDQHNVLQHDVMGPIPVKEPRPCQGGAGLVSTADDYLKFIRMLLGGGTVDGTRVLSPESVTAMRTDQLTDEQKRPPFLGMPFWIGRGFGLNLSVVTDPSKSTQLFGPGGLGTFSWPGAYGTWWQADPANDLILIYLIQNYPDFTGPPKRSRATPHWPGCSPPSRSSSGAVTRRWSFKPSGPHRLGATRGDAPRRGRRSRCRLSVR